MASEDFPLDPAGFPYPPYVTSLGARARERWDLCTAIASEISRALEPAGEPCARWVWSATRSYYFSDIPTGHAADGVQR